MATWSSKAKKVDNHHQEHHDLFAALRDGRIYNEVQYGAESTMTAILGRMATYSGQTVKWDDALAIRASTFRRRITISPRRRPWCRTRMGFIRYPCRGNLR